MKGKDKDFLKYTVLGAALGFAVTEGLRYFLNKKRAKDAKMNTP